MITRQVKLNESEQVRGIVTHKLASMDIGTGQDIERNQVTEGHSPTVEWESGLGNKMRKQGALTNCQAKRQEQVRTS